MNAITVYGRLGRDPELRTTSNGKSVANFSVAVSEKFGGKETITWFEVVAWEKLGEICAKHLSKGSQAIIEGKMQTRKWEDKQGNERVSWELVAKSVHFVGGGKSEGGKRSSSGDDFPSGGDFDPNMDVPF